MSSNASRRNRRIQYRNMNKVLMKHFNLKSMLELYQTKEHALMLEQILEAKPSVLTEPGGLETSRKILLDNKQKRELAHQRLIFLYAQLSPGFKTQEQIHKELEQNIAKARSLKKGGKEDA